MMFRMVNAIAYGESAIIAAFGQVCKCILANCQPIFDSMSLFGFHV
jgi:hypothetical protein